MGENAEAASRKAQVEWVAEVCHQVNKAYCEALGDLTQVEWRLAPQWQKDSAVKGVELHFDNPDSTPADSHKSWMAEKEAAGWVYGEVKDPDAKPPTHPCLVPFEKLPKEQQAKDFIFRAVVKALAE